VNHPSHRSIVSKGQKLFPACIPAVPHTEGGGRLVGEHHIVLRLVEHCLGLVLLQKRAHVSQVFLELVNLFSSGASSCVSNEASTGGELPQLHQRVLARRQHVFTIPGERDRRYGRAVMCLEKSGHTTV